MERYTEYLERGQELLALSGSEYNENRYAEGVACLMLAYNMQPLPKIRDFLMELVYTPNRDDMRENYEKNCSLDFMAGWTRPFYNDDVMVFPVTGKFFVAFVRQSNKFLVNERSGKEYYLYQLLCCVDKDQQEERLTLQKNYESYCQKLKTQSLLQFLDECIGRNRYDESYDTALQEYEAVHGCTVEANVYHGAREYSQGNFSQALKYAQRAYKNRKYNMGIWYLLEQCHKMLGNEVEALFFHGLQWKVSSALSLQNAKTPAAKESLRCAISQPNFAPSYLSITADDEYGPKISLGERLIGERGGEYGYVAGIFNDRKQKGLGTSLLKWISENCKNITTFGNMTYDLMRAKTVKSCSENFPGKEYILPLASTQNSQVISMTNENLQITHQLPANEFNFFRFRGRAEIKSEQNFHVGKPVLLEHSSQRRKLVLNILTDGLSWGEMKKRDFAPVPNIMRFFRKGIIFNNNYSLAEYTYPSLAAIETGMYLHHSQVFNPFFMNRLDKEYKTLSQCMSELGYYCVNIMGDGEETYNGVLQGHERLIASYCQLEGNIGVERTIEHLDTFSECDNFVFLHITDSHPFNDDVAISEYTQVKLPFKDRAQPKRNVTSVFVPNNVMTAEENLYCIKRMDAQLGLLFDYIEQHYSEDEYVVHLYSDHGASVYTNPPYLLGEEHNCAALMMRGAGIPAKGIAEELTSTVDIFSIMARNLGFEINPEQNDGQLPAVLGGNKEREYVISNSLYPGQTYKLCIRNKEYEFRLETKEFTDMDGTVDMNSFTYHIFTRNAAHKELFDDELFRYFYAIAQDYTKTFAKQK